MQYLLSHQFVSIYTAYAFAIRVFAGCASLRPFIIERIKLNDYSLALVSANGRGYISNLIITCGRIRLRDLLLYDGRKFKYQ